jgi:hypothetical protein
MDIVTDAADTIAALVIKPAAPIRCHPEPREGSETAAG